MYALLCGTGSTSHWHSGIHHWEIAVVGPQVAFENRAQLQTIPVKGDLFVLVGCPARAQRFWDMLKMGPGEKYA